MVTFLLTDGINPRAFIDRESPISISRAIALEVTLDCSGPAAHPRSPARNRYPYFCQMDDDGSGDG